MVHTGGARDLTYYILLIFGYLSNAPIHLWIYQMDWNSQSQWSKELGLRGPGLIKRCVGPSLFLALQRIPYLAVSSKLNFIITQYQDFIYLFHENRCPIRRQEKRFSAKDFNLVSCVVVLMDTVCGPLHFFFFQIK